MNLMFWKKKTNGDANTDIARDETAGKNVTRESADQESADADSSDIETSAKTGVLAKIKSGFSALIGRFRKPSAFKADDDQGPDTPESTESASEDEPAPRPVNLKKRLIIGGAVSLTILLLAGIIFAISKIFVSEPKQEVEAPASVEPAHIARPLPQAEIPHPVMDAAPKKISEPQVPIEEPKNEPQQQQPETTAEQPASDKVLSVSESGELTVSNKDPQAAALSLKEAIEIMNAGSNDYVPKKNK